MSATMLDAEKLVRDAVAAHFTTARICTETPSDITGPTIRVNVIGGTNQFVLDKALVDFDVFDLNREDARTLAHSLWAWLVFTLPGSNHVTASVTVARPHFRPDDNTSLRRFGVTQRLFLR